MRARGQNLVCTKIRQMVTRSKKLPLTCKLEFSFPINQQILWFQIPVKNPLLMAVCNSLKQLKQEPFCDGRFHAIFAHIEVLLQVLVEELEHQCELSVGVDNVIESVGTKKMRCSKCQRWCLKAYTSS
jgi:hypothetical protein